MLRQCISQVNSLKKSEWAHRVLFFGQAPFSSKPRRVSRKDAKIGAKAAKKPAEKNEILRVCFARGLVVAAPPRRCLCGL